MKSVLLIVDGLADRPQAVLGGRTPLAAANTPNLDRLAATGGVGRFQPTPAGVSPGSEVGIPACLAAAVENWPGRGWLEAAGRGIEVGTGQVAVRASLVSVSGPVDAGDSRITGIAMADGADLEPARAPLERRGWRLFPDAAGRHLLVLPGSDAPATAGALHDRVGRRITLPTDPWREVQERLGGTLALWPWGAGGAGTVAGGAWCQALVGGVDLARGIGIALGVPTPMVPGATGDVDTDLAAKAAVTLRELQDHERVALHVEGADMAAHRRDPVAKTRFLERLDRELLGPLLAAGVDMLVTCDHGTCSGTGRHLADPVPVLVSRGGERLAPGRFEEAELEDRPVLQRAEWKDLMLEMPVPC